jgi:hypothetical protein
MAGRPTDYKEEYNEQAEKLCKLGATDKELADFFEVAESTIYEWKIKNPEFSEAVKKGKIIADAEVANSFHKRAVGYQYDEVTFEKLDNKVNLEITSAGDIKQDDSYKKKVVTKEIPPDAGAALNWLKNRQPEKWRDKTEKDVRYPEGVRVIIEEVADDDEPGKNNESIQVEQEGA